MLKRADSYEAVYGGFRWQLPERYNIGVDVSDRHADAANRPALIFEDESGAVRTYGFRDLSLLSNRLANLLTARGIRRGDRVAVLLAQSVETALAHIAIYKMGAVAVPLFTLFGAEALEYRLADSGARALVTDAANLGKLEEIHERLPELASLIVTAGPDAAVPGAPGITDFWAGLGDASDRFEPALTGPADPALLIYTSGTTGPPKGALHGHRVLLGHLPGIEMPHEFFPQPGDLFWTPADWAWAGGLLDVLLPSLHHGVPVLAHRFRKFDPEGAFELMARHKVRNTFLPPTALKMMRQVPNPRDRHAYAVRSIGSGGESLGAELVDWGRETFGITISEFYGQTECNLMLGNCPSIMRIKPGSMGRPIPGHDVRLIDPDRRVLPPGATGEVAVRRPDPVMFLEYWGNPDATRDKFVGDWLLTGDLARQDADGYFWFHGRTDDIITSAGYRIGPGEIEECLMKHPAVALAAAVGVPDPVRTETVKAFIVLGPDRAPSDALAQEIRDYVRVRLAAHEYPRAVEFVDELPMTATGKIRRRDLRQREIERQGKKP